MEETEKVVILKVGTGDSVQTVGDLRNNIKELKKAVDGAKIGSEEYQKALNELKLNQNALKDANYATSSSLDTVTYAASGAGESYNALVHRMAAYKEEARAVDQSTADGVARFNELARQINATNSKLKAMDEKMGNHQRNVGNYKSALDGLAGGINAAGGSATRILGPIQMMTAGFKAASATPLIAILGALVAIVQKVMAAMNKSEAATHAWRTATAAFEPVLNLVNKAAEKFALVLAKVVEWGGKVIARLTGMKEASEEAIERTREAIELEKGLREQSVKEAKLEAEIADLRLKAADKQKYSAKERAKFLADAEKKELDFAKTALEMANKRADIAARELAATVSSTEDYEKAAQAAAAAYQEQAKWSQKLLQIQQQKNKVQTQINKEEKAGLSEIEEELKQLAAQYEKTADESIEAMLKAEEEALKSAKGLEARRLKDLDAGTDRRLALLERETLTAAEKEARVFEIEQDGNRRRLALLEEFRAAAYDRGDLQLALDYEQQIEDGKFEIEQAGALRRKALLKEEEKNLEETVKNRKALMQGMVSATTSILSAVADAYEASGEASEKDAERIKGLRIAAAVIDTLSGAVAAYMSGIKSGIPAPGNMILAATASAATLAAGYAQIAKIKNTDATGKGSASLSGSGMQGAAVNAPAPVQVTPVTRSLTSASEEERLNRMAGDQRIVLVYSDVQEADRRADVVASETDL